MLKSTVAAALFCFLVLAFSQTDAQAGILKLANKSASEIHAIYISDSNTDDWEENIIEGYMLPPGNVVDVEIPAYKSFDLLVEDDDGNNEDYRGFPGNTREITIQGGGRSTYR